MVLTTNDEKGLHVMWINIDMVPAGQHMFTVAYTTAPAHAPEDERWIEEEDIVAPSRSTVAEVIAALQATWRGDHELEVRFVGVSDQSDGYVMQENWEGIL